MRVCAEPDCDDGHRLRRGLCITHYSAAYKEGRHTEYPTLATLPRGMCSDPDCAREIYSGGLCNSHYARRLTGSSVVGPIAEMRPKGWGLQRNSAGEKPCPRCSFWLPVSLFNTSNAADDGLNRLCRVCARARQHNTTPEFLREMCATQGNACDICRRAFVDSRWVVDHNHSCCAKGPSCGKCIRALLCNHCNLLIGLAGESIVVLHNACKYLNQHGRANSTIILERIGDGKGYPTGFAGSGLRRVAG